MYLRLAVLPVVCPQYHRIYAQVRKTDKFPTHLISVGCKHFATLELQLHQHWVNKKGQLRKTKKVRCEPGAHRSWRAFPGICGFFPNSVQAPELIRLLSWFSQRNPQDQIAHETGLPSTTVGDCCTVLRQSITKHMISLNSDVIMGDASTTVLVDCSYFTKPMRNSAGFVGTQTLSMTVCVLGLLE